MFERTLSDRLEKVLDIDDRHAVLAYLASAQLAELASQPIKTIRDTLMAFYEPTSNNYETLKRFVEEDTQTKRPVLYCLYALVTNNIMSLSLAKLEYAQEWLNDISKTKTDLKRFANSLVAINIVLNYDIGQAINLPSDCYLNFAGASLPQANLTDNDLSFANLNCANLEDANLDSTKLEGALLNNVNASRANFTYANMKNVQTHDGNFESANLSGANLQSVMLEGSFKSAILIGADLRFAKLCSRTLDLKDADLATAIMDRTTQFLYLQGRASHERYLAYRLEKKAMLSQAHFFTDAQLSSSETLDEALLLLFIRLETNRDFSFLQQCIGHDLIIQLQQFMEDIPGLANELRETAYTNIFFETDNCLATIPNTVARSMYSLFGDNNHTLVDVFESDAQKQMRSALRM